MSAGQISSLFVIWSVTSFVFEVPSGGWADTLDRRCLLALSGVVYAGGFLLWTCWPTYAGFAGGFVLWGLSSAMMSGTFEALLYDDLTRRGAVDGYPRLMGWCQSTAMAANLAATAGSGLLLSIGGYALAGWLSVGVALVHGALALSLPLTGARADADVGPEDSAVGVRLMGRYVATLRTGLSEVARAPRVRHAVLVAAVLTGLTGYDEYLPLVARDNGASTADIPFWLAVVIVGQLVGTALAGRTADMSGRGMSVVIGLSALLVSLGALSGHPAGFLLIAVGFGLVSNAVVVVEARLQDTVTGRARATVTSVAGVWCEVVTLGVFAVFAAGAAWVSTATVLAWLGLPMVAIGLVLRRWLPARRT